MAVSGKTAKLLSDLQSRALNSEVRKLQHEVGGASSQDQAKKDRYKAALSKLLEATKAQDNAIATLKNPDSSIDQMTAAYRTLKEGFDEAYVSVEEPHLRSLVIHLMLLDSEGFIRKKLGGTSLDKARQDMIVLDEKAHAGSLSHAQYLEGLDEIKDSIQERYIPRRVLAKMGRDALPIGVNALVTHRGNLYIVEKIVSDDSCIEYGSKIQIRDPFTGLSALVPHSYHRQNITRANVFYDKYGQIACEGSGKVEGSYTWDTGCDELGLYDRASCERDITKEFGRPGEKPKIALCRALLEKGYVYS